MDLGKRTVQEGSLPMPEELVSLIQRMQSTALLKDFEPNEANAIDYCKRKGHWLKAHVDDRCVAGGVFCTTYIRVWQLLFYIFSLWQCANAHMPTLKRSYFVAGTCQQANDRAANRY